MVLSLAVVFTAGGVATAASAKKCVAATNIEAIIDDSGSMSATDPSANRAAAIKLLIAKSGNAKKTLGALEFGSGYPATRPTFRQRQQLRRCFRRS